MRAEIEFFYRPENPVRISEVKTEVINEDFSFLFNKKDKEIAEKIWNEVLLLNPKAFSKPVGLATLYDTTKGFSYLTTQFRDYVAVSRSFEDRILSPQAYENMRVGAVGAFLESTDGKIFVHRRSKKATHAAGFWDSSCAGLCHVVDGKLNPEKAIREKIARELGLAEEVEIKGITGIHSSYAPDFSGFFDIALKTKLEVGELEKRIKIGTFPEQVFVEKSKLADFIVEHYAFQDDMIGDGAAALMGALSKDEFTYVIDEIRKAGKRVEFGKLKKGVFVPL